MRSISKSKYKLGGALYVSRERSRGFAHERDLVRRLWKHGLAVIRAPASGSRARTVLYPDIVAIYKGKVVAIEVKTAKTPRSIYIESIQVEKLLEFVNRAGGEAFIAVKVIGTGEWIFVPVSKLERTEGGNYKLSKDYITSGIKLEALISLIKGVKRITDFAKSENQ